MTGPFKTQRQNKMNVLSYTRKKSFISFNNYLNDNLLIMVNNVKYLGVFFDQKRS